jgi:hypothetical protein
MEGIAKPRKRFFHWRDNKMPPKIASDTTWWHQYPDVIECNLLLSLTLDTHIDLQSPLLYLHP